MALIGCPECGQTISSQTRSCPHCGGRLDSHGKKIDYVTGEILGIQSRPGARAARPPLRYPSPAGVLLMMGGAGLVIVGSFMTWVRVGSISVSGVQTDGRITVVLGLLMLILALAARSSPSRFPRMLVMVGAFLSILVAAIDNSRLREGLSNNLIGAGIGTVFLGGFSALIGTFLRDR